MRRLLLIDDDQDFLDLVGMGLGSRGFEVLTAKGVADAEVTLGREAIELLITDLGLEDEGGLAFCARICSERPDLPVLVVTGYPEAREAALAMGARQVLIKPVTVEELEEALAAL